MVLWLVLALLLQFTLPIATGDYVEYVTVTEEIISPAPKIPAEETIENNTIKTNETTENRRIESNETIEETLNENIAEELSNVKVTETIIKENETEEQIMLPAEQPADQNQNTSKSSPAEQANALPNAAETITFTSTIKDAKGNDLNATIEFYDSITGQLVDSTTIVTETQEEQASPDDIAQAGITIEELANPENPAQPGSQDKLLWTLKQLKKAKQ
ncbi:MAG: hypothetical protein QW666_03650, partial [Candidatus Woesearchaeota archaeon]